MKSNFLNLFLFFLLFCLILGLFIYNLSLWPTPWFDEGPPLQVSKNLVQIGKYGLDSSEGFRPFSQSVTVGPTVTLPVALAFKVLGIGIWQARLISVFYGFLAIFLFYTVSYKVFSHKVAFLATLLLLVTPIFSNDTSASFLALSRMVMGDVPALAFLLAGCFFWFLSLEKKSHVYSILSGLAFGAAIITKALYVISPVSLLLVWVLNRLWYHKIEWKYTVIPFLLSILIGLGWYGYNIYMSETGFMGYFEQSATLALIFSISQLIKNARVLVGSMSIILGIPAFIYGASFCIKKDIVSVKRVLLISIIFLCLTWFILSSIGWLRYALPALVLMDIFISKFLIDLAIVYKTDSDIKKRITRIRSQNVIDILKFISVVLFIVLIILSPLQQFIKVISTWQDPSLYQFTNYLNSNITDKEIIETSEREIVFLTDHNYHQITHAVADQAIRYVQFNEPYPDNYYNICAYQPSFLVVGWFGRWTELYKSDLAADCCENIFSINQYELYKIKPDYCNLARSPNLRKKSFTGESFAGSRKTPKRSISFST